MMIRRLMIATAAATVFTMVPAVASAGQGFIDDDGSVHERDIEAIADEGITRGCNPPENTRFCPRDAVTRAEMATFMVRALGITDRGNHDFADDDGSVHEADIERLAAAGITRGCDPPAMTRFCPDRPVTRAQLASFFVRAFGYDDRGAKDFTDDDGSVHEADIERLAHRGITIGCNPPTNTRFCPDRAVTRAELATFMTRALDLPTRPASGFSLTDADLPLVSRYHVMRTTDEGDQIYVHDMQYWPRSFGSGLDIEPDEDDADTVDSAGRYQGWDALSPSTRWEFLNYGPRSDWMNFRLNRSARIAVVWRDSGPEPSWLSGWTPGGTVVIDGRIHPTFEKTFPAGDVTLGSVEVTSNWKRMYLVLLAESDGEPSRTAPAPAGFAAPSPNKPCPMWVHDLHTATGPDGATYTTWHRPIDPHYWCYFGHEHGSDPSAIPGSPAVPYGYVAAHVPQSEPDPGFKEFIFQDPSGEYWVRFVIHAGTAKHRRVCAQFHTLYVQVFDGAGTEMFHAGFKADYGAAFATSDAGGVLLDPTVCGYDMAQLAQSVDDRQRRRINVGASSNNYETWDSRAETEATLNLGMVRFEHAFDIRNPMSHCRNITCDSVATRDVERENGTRRTMSMSTWRADFSFDADHALGQGEYYTDPFGLELVSPGDPNAVRQYAAPGFTLAFLKNATANRVECVASDPWLFAYACFQIGGAGNLEHIPPVPDMTLETSLWNN